MLVRFPQEKVGKMRKLSRPWHGPFRVLVVEDPDVTVIKVYFPQDEIEPQEVFWDAVEPQDVSAEEELKLESAVDVPESSPRNQDRYS